MFIPDCPFMLVGGGDDAFSVERFLIKSTEVPSCLVWRCGDCEIGDVGFEFMIYWEIFSSISYMIRMQGMLYLNLWNLSCLLHYIPLECAWFDG